ncbi:MAG TPA: substrate-binding domain-containing protein [Pseudonocardiaceae bacterium]
MAGLLVLVVVAWFSFQYLSDTLGRIGCVNPATIDVAAEPAVAPALADLAAEVEERRQDTPEDCYRLQVVSQDSNTVADRLSGATGGVQPDVWVPESTFWLRRARSGGAIDVPEAGATLATSPVVLAVADPAARRLGWPDRTLTWVDVIGATPTAEALRVGLPDPARNPVGLSTLVGVRALTAGPAGTPPNQVAAAQVAALRRLSPNVTTNAADLFEQLAPAYDPGAIATAVTAFPTSEQAVLRHNNTNPEQRLVPVYGDGTVPALDFPYVVLPTATPAERTVAERFLETLLDRPAQAALQARGLRSPQGEAGADFPVTDTGNPGEVPPTPMPDPDTSNDVLRVWSAVNRSARMLTVVDISGSMNAQVPGTGLTRARITAEAAKQGLGLFKDTTDMGLWVFSNNLDGDQDYRELAPIGPMATERAKLIALADTVPGLVAGGKTNLYDTLLAAYRTVAQGWDPARLNLVLILTDGRDDDVSAVTRPQLIEQLTALQDPKKPLRVIFVGLGPDVDAGELNEIAEVTGGKAFTAPNPAGIRDVFAAALAELTCVPPECTTQ